MVAEGEAGQRLDRWFRRHFPALSHNRLQRLLRSGQVRVDGHRVKAGHRVEAGQQVRIPPEALSDAAPPPASRPPVGERDARQLRAAVLHRDASVLVLNKPPGLAVQGGTATRRHLDGMLDSLRFEAAERPRLTHRLDKDTSGVLVLGRTAPAAAALSRSFREGRVEKIYWAIVVGVPKARRGRIELALTKRSGAGGERVRIDDDGGRRAVTEYVIIDRIGRELAWLAFRPLTGRTHQIRAHAAALGTPILGDGKYGRRQAFLKGLTLSGKMHLHARAIALPHPDGGTLRVKAPLPPHFAETLKRLGFSEDRAAADPFADHVR